MITIYEKEKQLDLYIIKLVINIKIKGERK